jgi:hypothetical protein
MSEFEASSGASLRTSLPRLLPMLLIAAIIMGNGLLCITAIVPAWRTHENLSAQISSGNSQRNGQAQSIDDVSVLHAQIDSAQAALDESASSFLTQPQADGMMNALYGYAQQSGAQIVSIQSQQDNPPKAQPTETLDHPAYDVHVFRLQASGTVAQLTSFVSHIREAALPSVTLTNLIVGSDKSGPLLTMDILLYTSPYASGKAFDHLPTPFVVSAPAPSAQSISPTAMPAEPPLMLIYTDSFDKNVSYTWKLGAGWSSVQVDANKALEVSGSHSPLTFLYKALLDSAVQVKFKLQGGAARLSLRESRAGSYCVTFDPSGQFTLYRGDSSVDSAATAALGDAWHTLRMSAVQGIIHVSLDGAEVISASEVAPLPPGTISLALLDKGSLWVDDVQVWTLEGSNAG